MSILIAYLAGAIDSDGYLSIRKSNYHKRKRHDATNPVFWPVIGLKQIVPTVPELLHETFGGSLWISPPQTPNSHPLYSWQVTHKKAIRAAEQLIPFLRIKRHRAELFIELEETYQAKYQHYGYWFEQENPNWRTMKLVTTPEAAEMLGYTNPKSCGQAIKNGLLLAIPYDRSGKYKPRIPRALIEWIIDVGIGKDGRARIRPPPLIKWRDRLYKRAKKLNKIGVNGTAAYRRQPL